MDKYILQLRLTKSQCDRLYELLVYVGELVSEEYKATDKNSEVGESIYWKLNDLTSLRMIFESLLDEYKGKKKIQTNSLYGEFRGKENGKQD